ncbi:substrate-binding domain-containing protein [Sinanaerobacter chloroacetimidivorans]|jgi:ribose transport system substrate-binding protein|uniref:Substrate-binding domain-containing protein n=1 Tax=Sinanaerobacter chloroacetimidivorans TaxID=2818044 RepID=A0A8J7W3F3_9FIRM|nr:substrate-binding domain-containing protein [Sinanaerobacter chloroacetimidivorans]MBR0598381.1 substrate-binding domain-containing protein [Sinanaerobacter chloroacetimidivorans]
MKKFLAIMLVLSMVLALFASCGGSESADKGDQAPAQGFKVASHNAEIEGNPYRVVYENQLLEAIEGYKADGIVSEFASFTSNNDSAVESQQVEQTINDGYDLIMINPIAATGLDPVIAKAKEAGITYINADCVYNSNDIINVTVDQEAWARINVEWAVETLGSGSKIVLFNGIDGNSASELRKAVYHEVCDKNNVEIVKEFAHGWDDTQAQQQMAQIISSGVKFDGIVNQEGANGIMNAIEEAKIPYPGCITSSEEVRWIRKAAAINEKELVMPFIIVENPPGIGATALAVGLNLLQGHKLDDSKLAEWNNIKYTPSWIMTYDNMGEKLDSIKDLPDSTSVSSYMSLDEARAAYFVD